MVQFDPVEFAGTKVQVILREGRILIGWIAAVTQSHIHLALDREFVLVRLVPMAQVSGWSLTADSDSDSALPPMGTEIHGRIRRVHERVEDDVLRSYSDLDLQGLAKPAELLRSLVSRTSSTENERLSDEMLEVGMASARDALKILDRARLAGIVSERSSEIRGAVHVESIPSVDAIPNALGATITAIERTSSEEPDGEIDPGELIRATERPPAPQGSKSKRVDGYGSIFLGSALASSNALIAGVSGALGALPTLGVGAVAAALGSVTSIYTGLTAVKNGFKTLLEDEEG